MAATLSVKDMAILKMNNGKNIRALALSKMEQCPDDKQAMYNLMYAMTAMMYGGGKQLKVYKRP